MKKREIKFRAWNKTKGLMSDGFSFRDFDGNYFIPENWYLTDMHIMQYTGLKDKNGVEIYEGDIIYWAEAGKDEQNNLIVRNDDCNFYAGDTYLDAWHTDSCEVIGNIYENKDLIKE